MNKQELLEERDSCLNAIHNMQRQIREFENRVSYINGMLAVLETIEGGKDEIQMPN